MLLKIQHFCSDSLNGKIEIFTFSGCWKSGNDAIAKAKCLCTWNFHNSHLPSFSQKKVFENSLNNFEDTAFLLAQSKGKNWNFYIFCMLEKWQRCYCKSKMSVHLKWSTTIATFIIFQPKGSFWKFVKYFSRFSISAGTF